jgi:ubiquinone/menaquinone biosynthesis C-methylase UbiE
MIVPLLQRTPVMRDLLRHAGYWRSRDLVRKIEAYAKPSDRILDIGGGMCVICRMLRERGYDVTPLDVADLSFEPDIRSVLYDGETIPFEDDSFDLALLITVLHHTPDPDSVLKEARRVAGRIVVVEDIYHNAWDQYLTYFADSALNLEFTGHPRTNRTDAGWREAFERLGLKVADAHEERSFLAFTHGAYYLKRTDAK